MSTPMPFAVSSTTGPVTTEVTKSTAESLMLVDSTAASMRPLPIPAIMSAPPVPHANAAIHDRTDGANRATQAKKRRPTTALTHDALTASAAAELLAPSIAPRTSWASAGMPMTIKTIEHTVRARDEGRAE